MKYRKIHKELKCREYLIDGQQKNTLTFVLIKFRSYSYRRNHGVVTHSNTS